MEVVNIETKEVFTATEFRALWPNTSFPPDYQWNDEMFGDSFGVTVVQPDPYPELQLLETVVPGELREDEDGIYRRGWTIIPADPDELIAALTSLYRGYVQDNLDQVAVANGYNSILDACSYADEASVVKFQNDGLAFRKWRSLVWEYSQVQIPRIATKVRPQPTVEAFITELPVLVLPPRPAARK